VLSAFRAAHARSENRIAVSLHPLFKNHGGPAGARSSIRIAVSALPNRPCSVREEVDGARRPLCARNAASSATSFTRADGGSPASFSRTPTSSRWAVRAAVSVRTGSCRGGTGRDSRSGRHEYESWRGSQGAALRMNRALESPSYTDRSHSRFPRKPPSSTTGIWI